MSRLRTNIITNRMANGAPTVSNGLVISGVTTTSQILVGNSIKLDPVSGISTFTEVKLDDNNKLNFGGSSDLFTSNNPSDVIGEWDLNNTNSPHDGIFPYYVDTFTFELWDNAESMSQDQPSPFPGVHAISHKFKAVVGEFYRYSFRVKREDRGVIMVSLANPYDYASDNGNSALWNFSGQRGAETTYNISSLTATERLQTDGDGNPISSLILT